MTNKHRYVQSFSVKSRCGSTAKALPLCTQSTSGTLQNTLTVYLTDNSTGLQAPLDPATGNPQTFPVNEQPPIGRP